MAILPAYDASSAKKKKTTVTQTTPSYASNIKYFGSPEAYAKAIMEKEASGQKLSDPAAAEAFKKAYPELFKTSSSEVSSTSSSKSSSITQSNQSITNKTTSSITSSNQGSSPLSQQNAVALRNYFENKGYAVDYDSSTGNIRVYDPNTGNSSMIMKGAYSNIGGTAYATNDVLKSVENEIASGKYNVYAKQPITSQNTQQTLIQPAYTPTQNIIPQDITFYNEVSPILNEIKNLASADTSLAPLYDKALTQMLAEIDKAQQQIVETFEKQIGGTDLATQVALAQIRDEVQKQRQNLLEEMSRRGLLQSGIWLEMEDRLNKGQLTAEQQVLASRLADLQNRLTQALQSFANARLNAIQTYGLAGIQTAEREAQNRQERLYNYLKDAINTKFAQKQLELSQFQTYAPYYMLTEAQRQSLPLEWSQTFGEAPAGYEQTNVPVRTYVGNQAKVGYDEKTGKVIINGVAVKPEDVGGFIQNGVAYLPKNIVDAILGRY